MHAIRDSQQLQLPYTYYYPPNINTHTCIWTSTHRCPKCATTAGTNYIQPLVSLLTTPTTDTAGEGAYGKVYAGLNQLTGELMAVKALELVGRSGSAEAQAQLAELEQVWFEGFGGFEHWLGLQGLGRVKGLVRRSGSAEAQALLAELGEMRCFKSRSRCYGLGLKALIMVPGFVTRLAVAFWHEALTPGVCVQQHPFTIFDQCQPTNHKQPTPPNHPPTRPQPTQRHATAQEIKLYTTLKHKHVVGYIGASIEPRINTIFIFLEYVPGEAWGCYGSRVGIFSFGSSMCGAVCPASKVGRVSDASSNSISILHAGFNPTTYSWSTCRVRLANACRLKP